LPLEVLLHILTFVLVGEDAETFTRLFLVDKCFSEVSEKALREFKKQVTVHVRALNEHRSKIFNYLTEQPLHLSIKFTPDSDNDGESYNGTLINALKCRELIPMLQMFCTENNDCKYHVETLTIVFDHGNDVAVLPTEMMIFLVSRFYKSWKSIFLTNLEFSFNEGFDLFFVGLKQFKVSFTNVKYFDELHAEAPALKKSNTWYDFFGEWKGQFITFELVYHCGDGSVMRYTVYEDSDSQTWECEDPKKFGLDKSSLSYEKESTEYDESCLIELKTFDFEKICEFCAYVRDQGMETGD